MLDGIAPESRMLGDQKLVLKHSAIDPNVADRWAEDMTTDILGPPAREVAALGLDDREERDVIGRLVYAVRRCSRE